jgi:hypothetical protein
MMGTFISVKASHIPKRNCGDPKRSQELNNVFLIASLRILGYIYIVFYRMIKEAEMKRSFGVMRMHISGIGT